MSDSDSAFSDARGAPPRTANMHRARPRDSLLEASACLLQSSAICTLARCRARARFQISHFPDNFYTLRRRAGCAEHTNRALTMCFARFTRLCTTRARARARNFNLNLAALFFFSLSGDIFFFREISESRPGRKSGLIVCFPFFLRSSDSDSVFSDARGAAPRTANMHRARPRDSLLEASACLLQSGAICALARTFVRARFQISYFPYNFCTFRRRAGCAEHTNRARTKCFARYIRFCTTRARARPQFQHELDSTFFPLREKQMNISHHRYFFQEAKRLIAVVFFFFLPESYSDSGHVFFLFFCTLLRNIYVRIYRVVRIF